MRWRLILLALGILCSIVTYWQYRISDKTISDITTNWSCLINKSVVLTGKLGYVLTSNNKYSITNSQGHTLLLCSSENDRDWIDYFDIEQVGSFPVPKGKQVVIEGTVQEEETCTYDILYMHCNKYPCLKVQKIYHFFPDGMFVLTIQGLKNLVILK